MEDNAKGMLIIIGGAEDKYGESRVLKEVVDLIGGEAASLVILTTATEKPVEVGNEYNRVFKRLGVNNVQILNIENRDEANKDENVQKILSSAGIFFTGGDQLRITSIIGGTKTHMALQKAYVSGSIIIGTSAGASVMSSTMIVDGNNNDPARKCTLKMAPGFGLLDDAIIDQHFAQRGRIGRLLCGVAENPHMLGIGIDEDTAIMVKPDKSFDVIGTNSVTIIDGESIISSNVSELSPDEILAITNVTLHILTQGYGFNMRKRKVQRLNAVNSEFCGRN